MIATDSDAGYVSILERLQARGRFGMRLGLTRTRALLRALGRPERQLKGVLIGGTNGKGSTQALVGAALREAGLRPASLKLEITESMVMENFDTAIDMLAQLRGLGVGLSIDDFGTGYSSLSYLHRFPIDTLKIDRSFVTQMTDNTENAEIVRTIVTLARSLDMDVIAEGVESCEQLGRLRELGCDFGQGYLFSKAVAPGQALELLLKDEFSNLLSEEEAAAGILAA